jgi:hypothetical protein
MSSRDDGVNPLDTSYMGRVIDQVPDGACRGST